MKRNRMLRMHSDGRFSSFCQGGLLWRWRGCGQRIPGPRFTLAWVEIILPYLQWNHPARQNTDSLATFLQPTFDDHER